MPTVSDEIKWGADNKIENAPVLSPEEEDTLKKKMAAMDKLLADQQIAKYKIELFCSYRRSKVRAWPGAINVFESGSKLHGGGDELVYECPATERGFPPCDGFIGGSSQGYGHLVCPKCKHVWKDTEVSHSRPATLTNRGWARALLKFYIRLGHNADIYVKTPRSDLRVAAGIEQLKQMGGEKLAAVRTKKDLLIYPLKHIIKDVSNGASLEGRFYALLSA
jgi:hypothetical protein